MGLLVKMLYSVAYNTASPGYSGIVLLFSNNSLDSLEGLSCIYSFGCEL